MTAIRVFSSPSLVPLFAAFMSWVIWAKAEEACQRPRGASLQGTSAQTSVPASPRPPLTWWLSSRGQTWQGGRCTHAPGSLCGQERA